MTDNTQKPEVKMLSIHDKYPDLVRSITRASVYALEYLEGRDARMPYLDAASVSSCLAILYTSIQGVAASAKAARIGDRALVPGEAGRWWVYVDLAVRRHTSNIDSIELILRRRTSVRADAIMVEEPLGALMLLTVRSAMAEFNMLNQLALTTLTSVEER